MLEKSPLVKQFSCRTRATFQVRATRRRSDEWIYWNGWGIHLIMQCYLNGCEYRRDFPNNCPKAEVSFSQISIQFYIAGLGTKHFFNGFLILQKPLMVGMLGIAPVRKHSLAHRWVFPKQTAILKSSNIFVNRILAPRNHGSWLAHYAWSFIWVGRREFGDAWTRRRGEL